MNNWPSDQNPSLNNHNAGLAGPADNPMAYLQPPQTINPAQFQNQPYLNGTGRTSSPSFHNPVYQTNQVVPSKRPREDSLAASPRQTPGGLPGSRSQTPGAYPGYNPQTNGAGHYSNAPTPYQHLQNSATSNATPSPTIQQLGFNQSGTSQRPSTASPSPFSPHNAGVPRMSPAPSDHNSRVGTPHDNPQNFMQGGNFVPNFNQAQQFGRAMGNPQMNMMPQQQPPQGPNDAQRNYQLQIQAQARAFQQAAQSRGSNGGMPNPPMMNAQLAAMQQAAQLPKPSNPDDFVKSLQSFMAARGRPVDINPVVCGRQLNLVRIFSTIMRVGGSAKMTKTNQWPAIAHQMGFDQQLAQQAGQELMIYWTNNLTPYEGALFAGHQQKQHMRAASQGGQGQVQPQMSPNRPQHQDVNGQNHRLNQSDQGSTGMNGQMQNLQQPAMGQSFPQTPMKNPQNEQFTPQHRLNMSLDSQINGMGPQIPGPSPQKRHGSAGRHSVSEIDSQMPVKKLLEEPFLPETLPQSRFHGPINVDEISILTDQLLMNKPAVPRFQELGLIDIHALTMSIKSGMHAETRMALDTLITLSLEPTLQLAVDKCDDLMETLVDCARDQVDFLAEHATEVSDDMQLSSYEELIRNCRAEGESLQDVAEFGSVAYDLDRAADRLICITTLMRNFSFWEANFSSLGGAEVIRLLTNVIRYLGTKEMFLRNSRNVLDFMKDVIIYLSNLSHSLEIPGKEEALCLLHFLLAFAPSPPPLSSSSGKVVFASYNPNIHKYMPAAVDSMAKLLARDEPNRTYYKAIFSADASSIPSYDLLTRAFGLAVAPLPTNSIQPKNTLEARKPFILQGMLASEILSGLAPGSESPLTRSWLESEDGWAPNLLRLFSILSARPPPPPQPTRHGHPQPDPDPASHISIATHALATLKTLGQKSRTFGPNGEVIVPTGVWPTKEALLGALMSKDVDPAILRGLCGYAALED